METIDRLAVVNTLISLPNFSRYAGFELGDKINGDWFTTQDRLKILILYSNLPGMLAE